MGESQRASTASEIEWAGSVAVAVCTRARPRMLAATLASIAQLDLDGNEIGVIVVHNESRMAVLPVLDGAGAERTHFAPIQVVEERIGIGPARNRALREALERGFRWLAFIDDDEIADRQWLAALLKTATQRELALVGGPVRMQLPPPEATAQERLVWHGVSRRFAEAEHRSMTLANIGRDAGITIVTNNWLCDLEFVRRHGLRFDETTAFSGGEDSEFHRTLVRAGGRTGWAAEAFVYEEWPRERLTLSYHRRRGRDQAIGRFERKRNERGLFVWPEALAVVALRACAAVFWELRALVDGGTSRVRAARSMGSAQGVIAALQGKRSSHYEQVTGN